MKKKTFTVALYLDSSCSMAKVTVNEKYFFEGNYWDFHPGCHGPIDIKVGNKVIAVLDDFHGPLDFMQQVVEAYKNNGYTVKDEYHSYTYER
jgi:hypothetical protein